MMIPRQPIRFRILVTPGFNMVTTMGFVDPLRAANYIEGQTRFVWDFFSDTQGACRASNGVSMTTKALEDYLDTEMDFLMVSSSWTPENHITKTVQRALRRAARCNITIGGLDTGAFVMAQAGLLKGRRATVHYEHIDAFAELYPDTEVSEDLYVFDDDRISCCGGVAAVDLALHILQETHGSALANAAARYIFHTELRPRQTPQNPGTAEPLGYTVPRAIRDVISTMEAHLEEPLSIADICHRAVISHRQLNRLFSQYLKTTPALYYRDIRLDRARGLVTQTNLSMTEIAAASGFASQVHFSRSYKDRFGLPPVRDRIEGRIPFEFRAWPMHRKQTKPNNKQCGDE